MNKPHDPRDHLLADALHDDWTSGPASAMARRAAASARRRRAVRRGAVAIGSAALIAFASFTLSRESPALPVRQLSPASPNAIAQVAPAVAAAPAEKTPGYEIVSDEEFFALLRDRPLLVLPEEKGAKKFVVLAY